MGLLRDTRGRHAAWLLLQCRSCEKNWYFSSEKWQDLGPQRDPNQADFEPKILKAGCGKSDFIPATWVSGRKIGKEL